ncbi:MAG: hypothetical protein HQL37_16605, partial [Alphaproteobacteria bacterium]|nr:hypothetical protein [Alphaproteobacteria bacterium]
CRIVFGLPQNYSQHLGVRPAGHDRGQDRRASPLLLHVHRVGDQPIVVAVFLPARFLPENKVDVLSSGRTDTRTAHVDWSLIEVFLDGYFPNARPILESTP